MCLECSLHYEESNLLLVELVEHLEVVAVLLVVVSARLVSSVDGFEEHVPLVNQVHLRANDNVLRGELDKLTSPILGSLLVYKQSSHHLFDLLGECLITLILEVIVADIHDKQ
jgi:hypothetical protein